MGGYSGGWWCVGRICKQILSWGTRKFFSILSQGCWFQGFSGTHSARKRVVYVCYIVKRKMRRRKQGIWELCFHPLFMFRRSKSTCLVHSRSENRVTMCKSVTAFHASQDNVRSLVLYTALHVQYSTVQYISHVQGFIPPGTRCSGGYS